MRQSKRIWVYNTEHGRLGAAKCRFFVWGGSRTIVAILDSNGSKVVEYNYDAWGKHTMRQRFATASTTLANAAKLAFRNPFRYRGYQYDEETGLYYLRSRYYNPVWGRFINEDTIIGKTGKLLSHNVFMYCKNNSSNLTDVDGKDPDSAWFFAAAETEITLLDGSFYSSIQ